MGGDLQVGSYDLVGDAAKPGHMYAPASYGWNIGLQYNFKPNLFTTVTASQTRYLPKNGIDGNEYKYGLFLAANVFWNLTPRMQVGAEFDLGKRQNFDRERQSGPAHRRYGAVLILKSVALFEPKARGGIRGHAPVATGRETDTADLRTIGKTGTLKLLIEEAAIESFHPMLYDVIGILADESLTREEEDTARREAIAKHIIEEEVVQLVRADEVLGLLLYGAVGGGRYELGTDGGVDDVEEDIAHAARRGRRSARRSRLGEVAARASWGRRR